MKSIDELILEMLQVMRTKFDYDEEEAKKLAKKHKPLFEFDKERTAERTKAIEKGDTLAFNIPKSMLDEEGEVKDADAALLYFILQNFGYSEETGMIRKSHFDSLKTALEELESKQLVDEKKYITKGRKAASRLFNYWTEYQKEYGVKE